MVAPILPYDAPPTPEHVARGENHRRSLWWRYPSAGKIQKASFAFRTPLVKTMGYPTINNSSAYPLMIWDMIILIEMIAGGSKR